MNLVYLLLGSNEGNRQAWLEEAISALQGEGRIRRRSAVYETEAWGLADQPAFLNMVVELETGLSPAGLLDVIRAIEGTAGRQRSVKWGQRTLDLDILFYNDEVITTEELKIPHPFIPQRRFTLAPLNELVPDRVHPVLGKTVAELLAICPDPLPVVKLN